MTAWQQGNRAYGLYVVQVQLGNILNSMTESLVEEHPLCSKFVGTLILQMKLILFF